VTSPSPIALPENTGLAFLGEPAWPPSLLTARQAEKLLTAPNACGRPNSDVLRRRLAVADGAPAESWQIDFPGHFTAQEAALYEEPFGWLHARSSKGGWLNPHARPALRRALARVSRFLATPAEAATPDWRWIEEDLLPDATLLIVARDDDFIYGTLRSRLFVLWFHAHQTRLSAAQIIESFRFPWPPATGLSALTAAQEEHRHAIARAARAGSPEQLNSAVLAAYGWPMKIADKEQLENLIELNHRRAG
jgi:hypothetical protein